MVSPDHVVMREGEGGTGEGVGELRRRGMQSERQWRGGAGAGPTRTNDATVSGSRRLSRRLGPAAEHLCRGEGGEGAVAGESGGGSSGYRLGTSSRCQWPPCMGRSQKHVPGVPAGHSPARRPAAASELDPD